MKTVDKAITRTTKRDVDAQAPPRGGATGGNRRGGPGGNDGGKFFPWRLIVTIILHYRIDKQRSALLTSIAPIAFRDRAAGSNRNQAKSTDEAPREGARGGSGARVRGGKSNHWNLCVKRCSWLTVYRRPWLWPSPQPG